MEIRAAVARAPHAPLSLETLELDDPRAGEILVRVVATGVCHTDLVVRDGMLPTPQPVVLGHEGAGIVETVGEGVTKVVAGDHVVMTFNSCGACPSCGQRPRDVLLWVLRPQFPRRTTLTARPRSRNGGGQHPQQLLRPVVVRDACAVSRAQCRQGSHRRATRAARPAGLRRADRSRRRDERARDRAGCIIRRLRYRIGGAVGDHGRSLWWAPRRSSPSTSTRGASGSRKPSARPT